MWQRQAAEGRKRAKERREEREDDMTSQAVKSVIGEDDRARRPRGVESIIEEDDERERDAWLTQVWRRRRKHIKGQEGGRRKIRNGDISMLSTNVIGKYT
ncbi:hypothetical protein NDU88_000466 [Pleurodeles waltl]|uniref:Uncharacterized protein n=1 Tax=Pleurodeles waltl TaxID=8319 RepID=A0AAV7TFJ9_PLEWA|nr:hypothetical protein NDU88_000466 [Pleurodeles waltl]